MKLSGFIVFFIKICSKFIVDGFLNSSENVMAWNQGNTISHLILGLYETAHVSVNRNEVNILYIFSIILRQERK